MLYRLAPHTTEETLEAPMRPLSRKSFVVRYLFGLGLAGLAIIVFNYGVAPAWIDDNPAYAEFEEAKKKGDDAKTKFDADHVAWEKKDAEWKSAHQATLDQRKFEEALAGIQPTTALHGTPLEGIADSTRLLAATTTPAHDRSVSLQKMFFDAQRTVMTTRYLVCSGEKCQFDGPLVIFNDPERLARVLTGDKGSILPVIDGKDGPAPEPKAPPAFNRTPPPKTNPIPSNRMRWEAALVMLMFMVGYFGLGYVGDKENPFTGYPSFILGLTLLLPFLTSYLVGLALYASTRNIRNLGAYAHGIMFQKTFDERWETASTTIAGLRQSNFVSAERQRVMSEMLDTAKHKRDSYTLAQVESILKYIRLAEEKLNTAVEVVA